MDRRVFLTGAAAIGLGGGAFQPAWAQSFPSNVIRIVVPNSASTPPDIMARIVAAGLSEGEGWKVVVENKPGAVFTIGVKDVLSQPANGHTLFAVPTPIAERRSWRLYRSPGGRRSTRTLSPLSRR